MSSRRPSFKSVSGYPTDFGFYTGSVDDVDTSMPDGKGQMQLYNGDYYDGYFKAGLFCGHGAYTCMKRSNTNSLESKGISQQQYPLWRYVGHFDNGKRSGKGCCTWFAEKTKHHDNIHQNQVQQHDTKIEAGNKKSNSDNVVCKIKKKKKQHIKNDVDPDSSTSTEEAIMLTNNYFLNSPVLQYDGEWEEDSFQGNGILQCFDPSQSQRLWIFHGIFSMGTARVGRLEIAKIHTPSLQNDANKKRNHKTSIQIECCLEGTFNVGFRCNGIATATWPSSNLRYMGTWKNGVISTSGLLSSRDIDSKKFVLEGDIFQYMENTKKIASKNQNPIANLTSSTSDLPLKLSWKDKCATYFGYMRDGEMHGRGVFLIQAQKTSCDPIRPCAEDNPMSCASWRVYVGNFRHGRMEGNGFMAWIVPASQLMFGDLENGHINGKYRNYQRGNNDSLFLSRQNINGRERGSNSSTRVSDKCLSNLTRKLQNMLAWSVQHWWKENAVEAFKNALDAWWGENLPHFQTMVENYWFQDYNRKQEEKNPSHKASDTHPALEVKLRNRTVTPSVKKIIHPPINTYVGEFQNNQFHGTGKLRFYTGTNFRGHFKRGKIDSTREGITEQTACVRQGFAKSHLRHKNQNQSVKGKSVNKHNNSPHQYDNDVCRAAKISVTLQGKWASLAQSETNNLIKNVPTSCCGATVLNARITEDSSVNEPSKNLWTSSQLKDRKREQNSIANGGKKVTNPRFICAINGAKWVDGTLIRSRCKIRWQSGEYKLFYTGFCQNTRLQGFGTLSESNGGAVLKGNFVVNNTNNVTSSCTDVNLKFLAEDNSYLSNTKSKLSKDKKKCRDRDEYVLSRVQKSHVNGPGSYHSWSHGDNQGWSYLGDFKHGQFHGHGLRIEWDNGIYVVGKWQNGDLLYAAEIEKIHEAKNEACHRFHSLINYSLSTEGPSKLKAETNNNRYDESFNSHDTCEETIQMHHAAVQMKMSRLTTSTPCLKKSSKSTQQMGKQKNEPHRMKQKSSENFQHNILRSKDQETILFENGDFYIGDVDYVSMPWLRCEFGRQSISDCEANVPILTAREFQHTIKHTCPILQTNDYTQIPHGDGIFVFRDCITSKHKSEVQQNVSTQNSIIWGRWDFGTLVNVYATANSP